MSTYIIRFQMTSICIKLLIPWENRIRFQNELGKLEKCFRIYQINFEENKYRILHLAQNNHVHKYKLVSNWVDCSTQKRIRGYSRLSAEYEPIMFSHCKKAY